MKVKRMIYRKILKTLLIFVITISMTACQNAAETQE